MVTENIENDELCEWMVGVEWLGTTRSRQNAAWKKGIGLYAPRGVTRGAFTDPKTIQFIEAQFNLRLDELANQEPPAEKSAATSA
jgi:hypothetical protein